MIFSACVMFLPNLHMIMDLIGKRDLTFINFARKSKSIHNRFTYPLKKCQQISKAFIIPLTINGHYVCGQCTFVLSKIIILFGLVDFLCDTILIASWLIFHAFTKFFIFNNFLIDLQKDYRINPLI